MPKASIRLRSNGNETWGNDLTMEIEVGKVKWVQAPLLIDHVRKKEAQNLHLFERRMMVNFAQAFTTGIEPAPYWRVLYIG
jgi:hypothetical protein